MQKCQYQPEPTRCVVLMPSAIDEVLKHTVKVVVVIANQEKKIGCEHTTHPNRHARVIKMWWPKTDFWIFLKQKRFSIASKYLTFGTSMVEELEMHGY